MNATEARKLIAAAEQKLSGRFKEIEEAALFNQKKVLDAFRKNSVELRHFAPTTGYGHDDIGKNTLSRVFADTFHTESAIVSPLITSGTHAISAVLFGMLRTGDLLFSVTGNPYDTLMDTISGDNGSLKEYGIDFIGVDMLGDDVDYAEIEKRLQTVTPSVLYIQRSRGYNWRKALTVEKIGEIIKFLRKFSNAPIVVDNCYGEFTDVIEPTDAGANIIVGSLIKNPGGGLAPTGGYIAGDEIYVERIANRLTAPGIGFENGSYAFGYQYFYQGFFMAPHTVEQALKSSALFSCVLGKLGYEVTPCYNDKQSDIVTSVKFGDPDKLIEFCKAIQYNSPIDSGVVPEPWEMAGYADKVIMAAGAFVQGASIELSADAPIREPYIAYMQGSLTYEHAKIALEDVLTRI